MAIEFKLNEKIDIKELGKHLSNYLDLYVNPIDVWKKIISTGKNSYNLVILHILYYLVFVLLFIKTPYADLITYVLIEIGVTIFPLIIFIVPFIIFTTVNDLGTRWNRLFRLYLILKLQFLPVYILITLYAKWSGSESPYVFIENVLWLLWLAFIVTMPLLINLKLWKRGIWIILNYIFFLAFIFTFSYFAESFSNKLFDKLTIGTPNGEFLSFQLKRAHSESYIQDDFIFLILKKADHGDLQYVRTQFVTKYLYLSFLITDVNQIKRKAIGIDSLKKCLDTAYITPAWIDSIKLYPEAGDLTMQMLDSTKTVFDSLFNTDFNLSKELKDSSFYSTNKLYFQSLYDYLYNYQLTFTDSKIFKKRTSGDNKDKFINIENNYFIFLYKVDSVNYFAIKEKTISLENELLKREKNSQIVYNLLLYPVIKISEIYDNLLE